MDRLTMRRDAFLAAAVGLPSTLRARSAEAAADRDLTHDESERLKLSCPRRLTLPHRDLVEELEAVAAWSRRAGIYGDRYGVADFFAAFETKVANLLGFEAGCFMPTGTMAQLIVLRIYADRSGRRTVGVHPTSHHLTDEASSYKILHALTARVIAPADRPILAADVAADRDPLGALSLELPVRMLGGLQTWDQLAAVKAVCAERGVKLHMDGARLWETRPYYGRSYAEICHGFDSVYVSFYKGIGALGGALVAGDTGLIAEARTWRRRHGGDLFQLSPYVASAAMRFDRALDRMDLYAARAAGIARSLSADRRLLVSPIPTPTPLFNVTFSGDPATALRRRDAIARRRGIWLANSFKSAGTGRVTASMQIGEGIEALTDREAASAFAELVDGAGAATTMS